MYPIWPVNISVFTNIYYARRAIAARANLFSTAGHLALLTAYQAADRRVYFFIWLLVFLIIILCAALL